jgi:hypothetical protein
MARRAEACAPAGLFLQKGDQLFLCFVAEIPVLSEYHIRTY